MLLWKLMLMSLKVISTLIGLYGPSFLSKIGKTGATVVVSSLEVGLMKVCIHAVSKEALPMLLAAILFAQHVATDSEITIYESPCNGELLVTKESSSLVRLQPMPSCIKSPAMKKSA